MNNPGKWMASTLLARCNSSNSARHKPAVVQCSRRADESTTAHIRRMLRDHGPLTASEIAQAAGLRTALIGALLKNDIAAERVIRQGRGPVEYAWNHDHDEAEAKQLVDAINMVRRAGYSVTKPSIS